MFQVYSNKHKFLFSLTQFRKYVFIWQRPEIPRRRRLGGFNRRSHPAQGSKGGGNQAEGGPQKVARGSGPHHTHPCPHLPPITTKQQHSSEAPELKNEENEGKEKETYSPADVEAQTQVAEWHPLNMKRMQFSLTDAERSSFVAVNRAATVGRDQQPPQHKTHTTPPTSGPQRHERVRQREREGGRDGFERVRASFHSLL